MTPESIVKEYDAMIRRALGAVDGPPHWKFVDDPSTAKLIFDGEDCHLVSWSAQTEWDSPVLCRDSVAIDPDILKMSEADFAEWKRAERERYDTETARSRREREEALKRAAERDELETYLRLKAKFG